MCRNFDDFYGNCLVLNFRVYGNYIEKEDCKNFSYIYLFRGIITKGFRIVFEAYFFWG